MARRGAHFRLWLPLAAAATAPSADACDAAVAGHDRGKPMSAARRGALVASPWSLAMLRGLRYAAARRQPDGDDEPVVDAGAADADDRVSADRAGRAAVVSPPSPRRRRPAPTPRAARAAEPARGPPRRPLPSRRPSRRRIAARSRFSPICNATAA